MSEAAVREYLLFIRQPESLVDHSRVKDLEKQLETKTDPIERLGLVKEIVAASRPNRDQLEDAFIKGAKKWAEANDIPAEVFLTEGVPDYVLEQAGFLVPDRGAAKPQRGRKRRISRDQIQETVLRKRATFTIPQITNELGASTATVRNVIEDLIKDRRIKDTGEKAEKSGPGQAPKLYSKT